MAAGHREPAKVVEVPLIQPERTVVLQVNELIVDSLHVFRFSIGRETHDLVLTGVHLEARVVGERGVQQTERVWPPKLAVQRDVGVVPYPEGRGCPLANAVDREDRSL